jgi:hypothetical protein
MNASCERKQRVNAQQIPAFGGALPIDCTRKDITREISKKSHRDGKARFQQKSKSIEYGHLFGTGRRYSQDMRQAI